MKFRFSRIVLSVTTILWFHLNSKSESTFSTGRHLLQSDNADREGGFSILSALDGKGCSAHFHPVVASLIWTLGILYMFLAIAIVCDDFFVPCLECLSKAFNLSEDVAGATFMAAGFSAPELFTALTGVIFVEDIVNDNPGPGTIIGSAVFNISVIIGASVVWAGNTLKLDWWPVVRDGIYYSLSVFLLFFVFCITTPGKVDWWEGLILLSFYVLYCTLMKFNRQIVARLPKRLTQEASPENRNTELASIGITIDRVENATTGVGISPAVLGEDFRRRESDVVELLEAPPEGQQSSLRSSDLGKPEEEDLQKSHSFKTVSIVAVAIERMKSLTSTKRKGHVEGEPSSSLQAVLIPPASMEPEAAPQSIPERSTRQPNIVERGLAHVKPLLNVLRWPLEKLFTYTIPNCSKPRWQKWYLVSFAISSLWIALTAYLMVEFAIKMGRCFHLNTELMSLTVLAAGTSIPDCLAAMIVARDGKGDMAVSSAVGSNIFDNLFGLGFPCFLSGMLHPRGIPVATKGIVVHMALLFVVLFIYIGLVYRSKWYLKIWHGYVLFGVYVVYAVIAFVFERHLGPLLG